MRSMKIAIIGCGYVSEFYARALASHPELQLVGAYDQNSEIRKAFCQHQACKEYSDADELVNDAGVELVLNLTNPRSHFEVTKACIEAGKHVYSEKPLAMTAMAAKQLVTLADGRRVYLGSAPCGLLSETAQTLWHALRTGAIGRVRLVYGNFDDGMIAPGMAPWHWRNELGVRWPAKDEFEVGCAYEHAGYILTWLAAFFGPAQYVTSFSSCQIPDKGIAVEGMAPDFSVGCIEYADGIVARVTCSLVAPKDKSLTIIGDDGVLAVADVRNELCPVYVRRLPPRRRTAALERNINRLRSWLGVAGPGKEWHVWQRCPFVQTPPRRLKGNGKPVDFCRGPAEMAAAIRENRVCRLSAELGWHITELTEALQHTSGRRRIMSSFAPIAPLLQKQTAP